MSKRKREPNPSGTGRSAVMALPNEARAAGGKQSAKASGTSVRAEPAPRSKAKRRGRPAGSVGLTQEIWDTIINYTRAGAMAYVAAEAAGIEVRTFREWVQRGEGRHPTRSVSSKLRRFAREVRKAQAEARVAAEIRANQEDVKFWLKHVARSRPGREGWTELAHEEEARDGATAFDAKAVLAARLDGRAATKGEELEKRGQLSEQPPLRVVGDQAPPPAGDGRSKRRAS
jgi:hypothetical protein